MFYLFLQKKQIDTLDATQSFEEQKYVNTRVFLSLQFKPQLTIQNPTVPKPNYPISAPPARFYTALNDAAAANYHPDSLPAPNAAPTIDPNAAPAEAPAVVPAEASVLAPT